MINAHVPPSDNHIFHLLEQTLANLDQSGEEEAAIYVNNALEILKSKYHVAPVSLE